MVFTSALRQRQVVASATHTLPRSGTSYFSPCPEDQASEQRIRKGLDCYLNHLPTRACERRLGYCASFMQLLLLPEAEASAQLFCFCEMVAVVDGLILFVCLALLSMGPLDFAAVQVDEEEQFRSVSRRTCRAALLVGALLFMQSLVASVFCILATANGRLTIRKQFAIHPMLGAMIFGISSGLVVTSFVVFPTFMLAAMPKPECFVFCAASLAGQFFFVIACLEPEISEAFPLEFLHWPFWNQLFFPRLSSCHRGRLIRLADARAERLRVAFANSRAAPFLSDEAGTTISDT